MKNQLWPFQANAKLDLRKNMRRGIRRQILCAPCGSGKTEVAMSIIADAVKRGSTVVFIADRQNLVDQTSAKFFAYGIDHGVAMSNRTFGRNQKVQICCAQTLESRGFMMSGIQDLFSEEYQSPRVNLVIIDECHDRRIGIWDLAKKADFVIGLSATPVREGLGEFYEAVVNVISTNELINQGYLSQVEVVAPTHSMVNLKGVGGGKEFLKKELHARTRLVVGDVVPEWQRQTEKWFGGPVKTIVFCSSIADAIAVAGYFQMLGFDFRVISSESDDDEKIKAVSDFKQNKCLGIVNVDILTRGFDVPETMCMVDLAPTKSVAKHWQRIGRIMRTAEEHGKEFGLLIDHADNWRSFDQATQAFFASGINDLNSNEFIKAKRNSNEKEKSEMVCSCGYVLKIGTKVCPSCGKERIRPVSTLATVPGDMEHIDSVDGSGGVFEGNWWPEVCKYFIKLSPDDTKRAESRARGSWWGLYGRNAKWQKFVVSHEEPNEVVSGVLRRKYRQYLAIQNSKKKRRKKKILKQKQLT